MFIMGNKNEQKQEQPNPATSLPAGNGHIVLSVFPDFSRRLCTSLKVFVILVFKVWTPAHSRAGVHCW